MKKILTTLVALALVAALALALASCGASDSLAKAYDNYLAGIKAPTDASLPTLTVAMSPDFAPMEFSDLAKSGKDAIVGFDVLLANYIAKELGMQLVIKPMGFDACMAAVQSGAADLGISGFSWSAERADTFIISDYYIAGENETEQVVITTAANAGKFTTAESFADKKVGAQGGSLQELLVNEQLVTKGAKIVKMSDLNDLTTALISGQIDALACAKGHGESLIAANKGKLDFSGFEFIVEEKYKNNVVLLNKNTGAELCEKVNAVLAKAMSEGVYNDWYDACQIYAGIATFDDLGYDGDGNKITE